MFVAVRSVMVNGLTPTVPLLNNVQVVVIGDSTTLVVAQSR